MKYGECVLHENVLVWLFSLSYGYTKSKIRIGFGFQEDDSSCSECESHWCE